MIVQGRKSKFFLMAIGMSFLLAITLFTPCIVAADVVVVASPDVTDGSLSVDQLKAIFLGQMTSWPSGGKVQFVTMKDSAGIHEEFLQKYVGRSSPQFSNYWKKQVFTGKGRMPKQFDDESKLIEYVTATKGAIGYVSAGTATGSAKTISIK